MNTTSNRNPHLGRFASCSSSVEIHRPVKRRIVCENDVLVATGEAFSLRHLSESDDQIRLQDQLLVLRLLTTAVASCLPSDRHLPLLGDQMFKKFLAASVSFFVLSAFMSNATVRASVDQEKDAAKIEKVKAGVRKLGTGCEARVEVKLADGRKFKGYIKESNDVSFVVVDDKSNADVSVDYSQVREIKGKNGLTAAKIAINVGKAALIVAGVAGAATLLMFLIIPKT